MQSDDVRLVKERLDIAEVIGDHVRLKKSGNNFLGLCPFHDEKTPSFSVSPSRQTWHCFGCGRGGDVFTFVMEKESLSFREALEILAERAGITLTADSRFSRRDRNLYDVLEKSLALYRSLLKAPEGAAARSYLERRNLPPEAWTSFELGWAPASWDTLWKALSREGITSAQALEAGLILEGKNGFYDRFRGRIIFPVRDIAGKLLAFGGRLLDGEGAKYINSPEGTLYSKRRNLYLLHRAKEAVRTLDRVILVEGYMDALRLHLSGFPETCASLGTALTEEQALLIRRLTDRCYICYDSDLAGQEAAVKGMYVLQKVGLDVRVVELPRGKDPDDLLSLPEGQGIFSKALSSARPLVLHHIHLRREMLSQPEKRRKAADEIISGIALLSPVDASPYLPAVAAALGIFPHELSAMIEEARKRTPTEERGGGGRVQEGLEGEDSGLLDLQEAALCTCLWRDESVRTRADGKKILGLLTDERLQTLAAALLSTPSLGELEAHWHTLGDAFPLRAISLGGTLCDELASAGEASVLLMEMLEKRRQRREYDLLRQSLSRGEASQDDLLRFRQLARSLKGSPSEEKGKTQGKTL
ncbi:MAG: DNA primase [Synergistaceae bacterium]|nr:DNA primase [Synergistaceae bacterium]